MAVTLRGHTFYTESEVSAMTPSGTIDSQWETYDLSVPSGATLGWNANKFHVNKITGLVVGWIGLKSMNKMTNQVIGTNANLAIHNDMRIKYSGQFEFGESQSTASASYRMQYKELNGIWDTAGTLSLEGAPASSSYIQYYGSFIEHYAHIGSKYGKITTTDVKSPIYLEEGAFYDSNTADLITGRAWLRIDGTLPVGYNSNSFIVFYKNLWSGEVIVQYDLYPTTAGTAPAITMPSRCAVVAGRNCFTDVRYYVGYTTALQRQTAWMRLYNNQISFSATSCTRLTGSYFYPSTPEVRSHNLSYETKALWLPESAQPIPSAQNSKWPSSAAASCFSHTGGSGVWYNTTYYKGRSDVENWVWRSRRTGMVFCAFDMTAVTTSLPSPIFGSTQRWGIDWVPSYRYNKTSGTAQQVYFSGAGFLGTRASTTADATATEYTCNLAFYTGKTLGVADTTITTHNQLIWGTSGQMKPAASTLCCFTGFYLGNSAENIVK